MLPFFTNHCTTFAFCRTSRAISFNRSLSYDSPMSCKIPLANGCAAVVPYLKLALGLRNLCFYLVVADGHLLVRKDGLHGSDPLLVSLDLGPMRHHVVTEHLLRRETLQGGRTQFTLQPYLGPERLLLYSDRTLDCISRSIVWYLTFAVSIKAASGISMSTMAASSCNRAS